MSPGAAPERSGLRQERPFQLLWVGQTAALAGSQVQLVVLPVLMFQLTGSAAQTALVFTVQAAPYLVFGLLAGAVADRLNRRVIMITCNLCTVAAMASIPATAALGVLSPAQLYIAGTVSATAFVWHDAARFGVVPAIVGRHRIVTARAIMMSTSSILQITATAVAGILLATIGPENALWVTIAGYAIAALAISLIPGRLGGPRKAGGRRTRLGADIREGLRYVRRHPIVWPLTVAGFGTSLTSGALLGLLVVYGVRQLGLANDDAWLGWLFTGLAVGGLAAALSLPALSRRVNQARISLVSLTAMAVLPVSIASVTSLPAGLVLLVGFGAASALTIGNGMTLRQQLTPDRLQGRVNVTGRMLAWGGQPIGAAVAGALADRIGIPAALIVMTLGVATSAAYAWSSALRRTDAAGLAQLRDEADRV